MPIFALLLAAAASTAQLDAAITKQIDQQKVTGAAVGVYQNGTLIDLKTYGLRDVAKNLPVDADTRFEIGSVTKQFTAAAILQLQEQGKLSIDDPLSKYLPSFPHASEITLRQLLNQVSGLPNYTEMAGADMGAFANLMTTPNAKDKIYAFVSKPLHFTPGTKWEYSNTNYWVLGNVVAVVSGMSYEDYVRVHIFKPAGMTHSGFVSDEASFDDFAIPYWEGAKDAGPAASAPKMNESWPAGAGAIVSTIGDLAAWDLALATGKIISPQSFAEMTASGHLTSGKPTNYGFGLEVGPHEGHERVGHNGGTVGSLSVNATYPADHLIIIVLENDLHGQPQVVESAVLETIYPDALAAARKPAPDEDLAARKQVVHLLDQTLHGTLAQSELSPQMQKMLTPEMQKQNAAHFAALGAPTAVIYKQSQVVPDGTGTFYVYRVQFEHSDDRNFQIELDKAGVVVDMSLAPAG